MRISSGSLSASAPRRISDAACEGESIVLDLVVRDGPSREDPRLLRKADLVKDELGLDVRVTVARSVPSIEAAASAEMRAARNKVR